jgi:hypothetical protein
VGVQDPFLLCAGNTRISLVTINYAFCLQVVSVVVVVVLVVIVVMVLALVAVLLLLVVDPSLTKKNPNA